MRTFIAVATAVMLAGACLSEAQVRSTDHTKAMVFLASVSYAGQVYTWTGSVNSNWSNTGNWAPSGGYPGQLLTDDDVIIDRSGPTPPPSVTLDTSVTIRTLEITGDAGETDLLVESGEVLRIDPLLYSDANHVALALRLAENSQIKLLDESELWFDNDAIAEFGHSAEILLAPTTDPAVIGLAHGVVVTAKPPDGESHHFFITASGDGILTGSAVESPDLAETFVLYHGVLRGNWTIDPILVNNGTVATGPDGVGPGSPGEAGDMHLTCRPKGGTGTWLIAGTDSNPKASLTVNAALVPSGHMEIAYSHPSPVQHYGHMTVNYPVVGIGTLRMYRGGKLTVDAGAFFEYNREVYYGGWLLKYCPPYD